MSEFYRTKMEYGISHELNIVFCCALFWYGQKTYRKTSNIRHTLMGNKNGDHSDVVGASPVGAAPTTSSFSFRLNIWLQGLRQRHPQDSTRIFLVLTFGAPYIRDLTIFQPSHSSTCIYPYLSVLFHGHWGDHTIWNDTYHVVSVITWLTHRNVQ